MESIESDSTNSGLVNGLTDGNDGGIPSGGVGVVKRSKKSGQLRSSASSQGSSIRGELTLVRGSSETSTATTTSDEEEERRHIIKRRKKKTRKSQHHHHHSVIHHQPTSNPSAPPPHDDDDDDDERTDSANEDLHRDDDDGQRGGAYIQGSRPRAARSFKLSAGGIAPFDPTSSILKPLSPTMLNVGYGTELMVAHPQQQQGDFSNVASLIGGSPHQSEGQASTGGIVGGVGLSPEQTDGISRANVIEHDSNPVISLLPTTLAPLLPSTVSSLSVSNTGTPGGGTGGGGTPGGGTPVGGVGSILNPSSSSISAAANALPFAGWWGQHTAATAPPIYSPFCGPSGSIATTPVAGASDNLMRPGSSVLLRAVICQESEGVLIVNVQWRNKSYSGSLIDVSQHQWAPPRLMEGFQDMPVQLKDLYAKQELEKEPVDVVIDEEKDDVIMDDTKPTASKQQSEEHVDETPPTRVINETIPADKGGQTIPDISDKPSSVATTTGASPNVTVTTSTTSTSNNNNTINNSTNSKTTDVMMKPPNGLKAPPTSSSVPDKLKPITLPAFDAVKSPQPQIGRDDNDANNRKKDHGIEGGVAIPDTHRNLNTLVDVAAKMKPVSNETPPTNKNKANNGGKNVPPHHHQETGNDKAGSSIEQHQLKDSNKAPKEERPGSMSSGIIPHKYPSPDDPSITAVHHPSFNVPEGSISPEKQHHPQINEGKEDRGNLPSKKTSSGPPPPGKQIGQSWHPPVQESKDSKRGSPSPSIPNVLNSKSRSILGEQPHHLPPTLPYPTHPPNVPPPSSSVIHSKPTLPQQKRKRPNNETSSKRPSPPLKDRDNSSLGGGGGSIFTRPFEYVPIQQDKPMKPHEQQVPAGFQYDPSLPMNWDYQLMSYTLEKEKQAEANRNTERSTPPTKIQKRSSHPLYELGDHPPSSGGHSPTHFNQGGAKRSTSTTNTSNNAPSSKISPSVVIMPPDSRHLMLQEMHPPSRPARPSSKGGGVPSSHIPSGKSSSRKGNPSRRPDNVVGGGIPMIKQEPSDHGVPSHHMLPPGGGTPHMPGHHVFILNSSSAGGNTPLPVPSSAQASPWGGVISNNPSSSQPHRRTPSDNLSLTRGGSTHNRSPSPAPNKKPEWPSHTQHMHQQPIKHESRHSNITGDKHSNSNVSTHGSSSSGSSSSGRGHHGNNKHDTSSRHLIATGPPQSHPIAPPQPSVPAGAQALSPSYNIAELRNGVSVEWMKHMQLMQIDALKQGGIVGHAPQIPAPAVHPQDLALWQSQMAQLAMQAQLPVDQAAAIQMQALALQQQQQHQHQQQNEAVTQAALAQGFFPTLQFPATQVLPFPALAQPPKRDT